MCIRDRDNVYQACHNLGFDQVKTIDTMLDQFHVRRIFKGGWLEDMSLCIALIGPRGSGKSVGMTGIAILDGLLTGRRVVSNLPIAVAVRYRDCEKIFRTEDLDASMMLNENEFNDNYYDVLVCIDEVNTYLADSQRTMSNQALFFASILQQMRHRKLDFIFTTQDEGWNTNRTRFQTDFYIQCRDNAMMHGKPRKSDIGKHSQWRLHDMSGLVTGEVMHKDARSWVVPPFDEKTFWNTPFWDCYDTQQMQKREKYIGRKPDNGSPLGLDLEKLEALRESYQVTTGILSRIIGLGMERIPKNVLWDMLEVTDSGMKTKIGKVMIDLGCRTIEGSNGREYALPSQAEMVKNLAKMGLKIDKKGESNA